MHLLPQEWDGTHPYFPLPPVYLRSSLDQNLFSSCAVGTILGTSFAVLRRGYRGVFRLKFAQQPHLYGKPGIWSAVGHANAGCMIFFGLEFYISRHQRRREASAILKEAGIAMPAFKYWERTKEATLGDVMFGAGAVTSIATLALQKTRIARLSTPAIFGQVSFAMTLACIGFLTWRGSISRVDEMNQWILERDAARKAYEADMGKTAPFSTFGYSFIIQKTEDSAQSQSGKPDPSPERSVIRPIAGVITTSPQNPADAKIEPVASGSQPYQCFLVDGSPALTAVRDYMWEPENAETGIKDLKKHVEDLAQKRAKRAQEAAILFQEVARRENKYLSMDQDEKDTEAGRKFRKGMELLSSLHSSVYLEIAEIDWLMSNSKKMILQLETNGTWVPKSAGTPDPEVREAVLDQIRTHKRQTETLLQQLRDVAPSMESQSEVETSIKDMKENVEATSELVEYFEDISKSK